MIRISVCLLGIVFFSFPLVGAEDLAHWRNIALETDEPAVGLQIVSVTPGSRAEELGLKPGDFVTQFGETLVRSFWIKRSGEEQMFFVRGGGEAEEAVVQGGKVGFRAVEVSRPWVPYLRGDLGVSDPRWDVDVFAALREMQHEPEAALASWERVEEAGYEPDELSRFIKAYIAWKRGTPVALKEVFEAIHDEFEVMPPFYFFALEDMAYATNQIDVLGGLKELDPESSSIYEKYLERWMEWSENRPADHRPITVEDVMRRHDREITAGLNAGDKEGEKGVLSPKYLKQKRAHGARPGHFRYSYLKHPEDLTNTHIRVRFRAGSFGNHERFGSTVRMTLSSATKLNADQRGATKLAEILVGDSRDGGDYLTVEGGTSYSDRKYLDTGIDIPKIELEEGQTGGDRSDIPDDPELLSDSITFDMICDSDEVAVFCNGISYMQLPSSVVFNDLNLVFHLSGTGVMIEDFKVWKLND